MLKKIVQIEGNGKTYQEIDVDFKIALFSFFIEPSSLNNVKGQVHFRVFNKLVLALKFNSDTSKYKLIRHVFVFGKEMPYDCSL